MTDRKEVGVRIPAHPVPPAIAALQKGLLLIQAQRYQERRPLQTPGT